MVELATWEGFMEKLMSVEKAVELVKDGDTVAIDGSTGGFPEEILIALGERFLKTGHPRDLTIIGTTGSPRGQGIDHLAHEGMVKRLITTFLNLIPKLGKMVLDNDIEGYMLPFGVITQLIRDVGAGRPGLVTQTGLKTFVDPRQEGGKINEKTKEDLVEVVELGGKEWLFYKTIPINVAIVRGTTADELGNTTLEMEAMFNNVLTYSQAAKACNGKVILQIARMATRGTLNPQHIRIPGIYVDAIVVAKPENHWQTYKRQYNPGLSGEVRVSVETTLPPLPLDARTVIGKRVAVELRPNAILNVGGGMPEFAAEVASYEGLSDYLTMTVEHGPIGGIPLYGLQFGTAINPDAILDIPAQFDYYDGTGPDITIVGFGETDRFGNVNVSKLRGEAGGKGKLSGVGGFMNVTQSAKKLLFCGSFTYNPKTKLEGGRIQIIEDGKIKFVEKPEQITFSGERAVGKGQEVLLITERAVFKLTKEGWMLIELAPGIDLEEQVLKKMEFKPLIAKELKEMPKEVFLEEPRSLNLLEREDFRQAREAG